MPSCSLTRFSLTMDSPLVICQWPRLYCIWERGIWPELVAKVQHLLGDFVVLIGEGSLMLCKQRHGTFLLSEPCAPITEHDLSLQLAGIETMEDEQHTYETSLTIHKLALMPLAQHWAMRSSSWPGGLWDVIVIVVVVLEKTLSYLARLVQWIDDCRKLATARNIS